jgi:hypothetical protein
MMKMLLPSLRQVLIDYLTIGFLSLLAGCTSTSDIQNAQTAPTYILPATSATPKSDLISVRDEIGGDSFHHIWINGLALSGDVYVLPGHYTISGDYEVVTGTTGTYHPLGEHIYRPDNSGHIRDYEVYKPGYDPKYSVIQFSKEIDVRPNLGGWTYSVRQEGIGGVYIHIAPPSP